MWISTIRCMDGPIQISLQDRDELKWRSRYLSEYIIHKAQHNGEEAWPKTSYCDVMVKEENDDLKSTVG